MVAGRVMPHRKPPQQLSLAEKTARLFMVGSDSPHLVADLEPFAAVGLGGVLLFRHHLQDFSSAGDVREFLHGLRRLFGEAGLGFIGIDQEGGQVERLPHWLFPTGVLPYTLGLGKQADLCREINRTIAQRLRWLGIDLNFTPTVDLQREAQNPIIGVRAYGETPEVVIPFARDVLQTHCHAGVLPVLKHFPGHGSGTLDSHETLPCFEHWDRMELAPYQALMREDAPAVMVAHGLYPTLAKQYGGDPRQPASLSKAIVTDLLRNDLGFKGLVFTDDLMMGAVWQDRDPVEVALSAFEAGADMLVYRRAQPEAQEAYVHLLKRFQRGKLSESDLDQRLARIFRYQATMAEIPPPVMTDTDWRPDHCHDIAFRWARAAQVALLHQFISPLPLVPQKPWILVAPDRAAMVHYAPDASQGRDLLGYCRDYGIPPRHAYEYVPTQAVLPETTDWPPPEAVSVLVFVAFNSHLHPAQQALYHTLRERYRTAKIILVSAGMPTDRAVLKDPWVHLQLASYRPAGLHALVDWLTRSPGSASDGLF